MNKTLMYNVCTTDTIKYTAIQYCYRGRDCDLGSDDIYYHSHLQHKLDSSLTPINLKWTHPDQINTHKTSGMPHPRNSHLP
jgi:hypothetical protein